MEGQSKERPNLFSTQFPHLDKIGDRLNIGQLFRPTKVNDGDDVTAKRDLKEKSFLRNEHKDGLA